MVFALGMIIFYCIKEWISADDVLDYESSKEPKPKNHTDHAQTLSDRHDFEIVVNVEIPLGKKKLSLIKNFRSTFTELIKAPDNLFRNLLILKHKKEVYGDATLLNILSSKDRKTTTGTVKYFVEKEKDGINEIDSNGSTPLHLAWDNDEYIEILLEAGADPLITNSHGQTILHLYCKKITRRGYDRKIVQLIITKMIDLCKRSSVTKNRREEKSPTDNDDCSNVFHLYIRRKFPGLDTKSRQMVVDNLVDTISKKDSYNLSAYDYALRSNKRDILYLLASNENDKDYVSFRDESIATTIKKDFFDAVELADLPKLQNLSSNRDLLKCFYTPSKQTVLHFAVLFANSQCTAVVRFLINCVDDIFICTDELGLNPFHYACISSREPVLEIFLSKWPTLLNMKCNNRKRPLHLAVENECFAEAELLLKNNDIDLRFRNDENILHLLAKLKQHVPLHDSNQHQALENLVHLVLSHTNFKTSLLNPSTNGKAILDFLEENHLTVMMLQICAKIYGKEELTISDYQDNFTTQDEKKRVWLLLDFKNGWESLCKRLVREGEKRQREGIRGRGRYSIFVIKDCEMDLLSDDCFFVLGNTLFRHMSAKMISVKELRSVAHKRKRKDIKKALKGLNDEVTFDCLPTDYNLLELKVCLGKLKPSKDQWSLVCEDLRFEKDTQMEIERNCIVRPLDGYSSTKHLFEKIYSVSPELPMLDLLNALESPDVNRKDVSKLLLAIIKGKIVRRLSEIERQTPCDRPTIQKLFPPSPCRLSASKTI